MLYKTSRKEKKNYTFGYLNKEASWSCVRAEGGGCGVLSPQHLQGVGLVMEGQGGPCPQPVTSRQEGNVSPSLTGEAPSQLQGSWRAEQQLQGRAPSFGAPRAPVPCCDTWLGAAGTCPHLLHVTTSTGSVERPLPCLGWVCAPQQSQPCARCSPGAAIPGSC